MKICVLGPIYPYRGGIALYTTLMSKALAKRHDVTVLSYSMQYPRFLYRRGPQKDVSNPEMAIPETEFILNTVSPFSWAETARRINQDHPDLLILPWWHPYFAPCYWGIIRLLSKTISILFICHNVLPHETFPMQRMITKSTLRKGRGFLVHSQQDEEILKTLIGDERNIRKYSLPILEMNRDVKSSWDKNKSRKQLKLYGEDIVLLFFGFIREYKGLKVLLKAYPEIVKRHKNIKLLIVGELAEKDKAEYNSMIEEAGKSGDIIVVSEYVPEDRIGLYFSACDVVVLPYLSATQSGVIPTAYAFGKPVITTNVGGLAEVVDEGETGYVIPPGDENALANAVDLYVENMGIKNYEASILMIKEKMSWDGYAKAIEEIEALW